MNTYCVYFTSYRGNKLPPFYIGSSTVAKVQNGYHGSVTSRKWSAIWHEELKTNPHLFRTKVVCTLETRREATIRENQLQRKVDAVKSPMYINESFASGQLFWGDQKQTKEQVEKRAAKIRGTIWINRSGSNRRIHQEHLNEFLSDGWMLGRAVFRRNYSEKYRKDVSVRTKIMRANEIFNREESGRFALGARKKKS